MISLFQQIPLLPESLMLLHYFGSALQRDIFHRGPKPSGPRMPPQKGQSKTSGVHELSRKAGSERCRQIFVLKYSPLAQRIGWFLSASFVNRIPVVFISILGGVKEGQHLELAGGLDLNYPVCLLFALGQLRSKTSKFSPRVLYYNVRLNISISQ